MRHAVGDMGIKPGVAGIVVVARRLGLVVGAIILLQLEGHNVSHITAQSVRFLP